MISRFSLLALPVLSLSLSLYAATESEYYNAGLRLSKMTFEQAVLHAQGDAKKAAQLRERMQKTGAYYQSRFVKDKEKAAAEQAKNAKAFFTGLKDGLEEINIKEAAKEAKLEEGATFVLQFTYQFCLDCVKKVSKLKEADLIKLATHASAIYQNFLASFQQEQN